MRTQIKHSTPSKTPAHGSTLFVGTVKTPLGTLTLVTDSTHVRFCSFGAEGRYSLCNEESAPIAKAPADVKCFFRTASDALDRYFRGEADALTSIPTKQSGTEYQQSVWKALRQIRYGKVMSYSEVARKAKRPEAVRGAGSACGANQILLFVPCHRVIREGSSPVAKRLGGFGAGIERKLELLKHEGLL